jgi:uncharacterized lipoprotein NlpE involved in copper resistance
MMKKLIASMLICFALVGCANLKFQWSASYATDNFLEDIKKTEQTK